jgi:general stress protein 26
MAGIEREPAAELDIQFSSDGAAPTPWAEARELLEKADIYWLTTVRPDGRPHVTPLLAVWLDGMLHFCTGPGERKAKNIERNSQCAVTTGFNNLDGIDVVVEGVAVGVSDEARLQRLASMYASKYDWHYTVRDGAFYGDGGLALVFEISATRAFAFGKGETSSQTRYSFQGSQ